MTVYSNAAGFNRNSFAGPDQGKKSWKQSQFRLNGSSLASCPNEHSQKRLQGSDSETLMRLLAFESLADPQRFHQFFLGSQLAPNCSSTIHTLCEWFKMVQAPICPPRVRWFRTHQERWWRLRLWWRRRTHDFCLSLVNCCFPGQPQDAATSAKDVASFMSQAWTMTRQELLFIWKGGAQLMCIRLRSQNARFITC